MNKPLGYIKCTEMQNGFFSHPTVTQEKELGEEGRERTGKGSRNGFNINCSVKTRGIKNSEEGFQVLPHEGTLMQVDVLRR